MEKPKFVPEVIKSRESHDENAPISKINKEAALNSSDIEDPLRRYEENKREEEYEGDGLVDTVIERLLLKLERAKESLRTMKSQTAEGKLKRDILLKTLAEEIVMIEGGFLTKEEIAGSRLVQVDEKRYTNRVNKLKRRVYDILRRIDNLNFYEGYSTLENSLNEYGYLTALQDMESERKMIEEISHTVRHTEGADELESLVEMSEEDADEEYLEESKE